MGGSSSTFVKQSIMSVSPANSIKEMVTTNKVMIFSKSYCPYCTMAKNVFEEMGQAFQVVELDQHPQGAEMQKILGEMTGASTVPRVFVNGKCIGGGTDARQLQKEGKMKMLLE